MGKFKLAAVAAAMLVGSAGTANAAIIAPNALVPAGVAPYQYFQLVFVTKWTSGADNFSTNANSSFAATYDNVAAAAVNYYSTLNSGNAYYDAISTISWNAFVSTSDRTASSLIGDGSLLDLGAATGTDVAIYTALGDNLVATNASDFLDGTLSSALNVRLDGTTTTASVWTGSAADGTVSAVLGVDPATFGSTSQTNSTWANTGTKVIATKLGIYAVSEVMYRVPEPSAAFGVMLGAFGLVAAGRRRKIAKTA